MDPSNRISRYLPVPQDPVRLDLDAERFGDVHEEAVQPRAASRQQSFTQRMMIDAYFRELQAATSKPGRARKNNLLAMRSHRTPPTAEDIRIHAWLSDRLAALDRNRSGLWPRLLRFLRTIARMPGRLWRRED
jgi:hypothetical protein